MATEYLLRDIDPAFWSRVAARAKKDGRSLRGLILWLLQLYVSGKLGK